MENATEEVITTSTTSPEHVVKTTKRVVPPEISQEHPQVVYNKKKAIFRTYQVVWYIVGFIEILLGFRITLEALGANPYSGFTNLVYSLSNPFAMPFQGILGITVTARSVFDWSIIIAGAVYALVGIGIVKLLQLIKPVTPEEVEHSVDVV